MKNLVGWCCILIEGYVLDRGSSRLMWTCSSITSFSMRLDLQFYVVHTNFYLQDWDIFIHINIPEFLVIQQNSGIYTVGDFMTKREELHVVKSTTSVDEGSFPPLCCVLFFLSLGGTNLSYIWAALEMLVEHRITGFPVIDDEWNLVSGIILYLNIVFLKHTTIYGEPSYWVSYL